MSRVRPPENIEIASLRKKQRTVFDPMTPGAGTPWEDRGTHGTVGAFIKTCMMSMTSPGKLMDSIRRPETVTDARGFVIGISGIWAISAVMHYAFFVWRASKAEYAGVDTTVTAVLGIASLVGAGGGCFFLFKIYCMIYGRLAAQEKDSVLLPEPLIYNVNAYGLGPSLLALIPLAGPPLALLWVFVDLVKVGSSRFRLRLAGAIIDALLSFAAVLAIAGTVYFVGEFLILHKAMDYDAVVITPPPSGVKAP